MTAWGFYAHIAGILRERIISGVLPPGDFPSEVTLSAEFRVARTTLRRALRELEKEGLIESLPGLGRKVLPANERGKPQDTCKLPRFRQIAAEFRAAIENGTLRPGDALPPESKICIHYGVSRGTVRQALADLAGSELVEPVQGKGWFVRTR